MADKLETIRLFVCVCVCAHGTRLCNALRWQASRAEVLYRQIEMIEETKICKDLVMLMMSMVVVMVDYDSTRLKRSLKKKKKK